MEVVLRIPNRQVYRGKAAKLYAKADSGAFGILPKHTDFVSTLVPSVLIISEPGGEELFFGIDQGILVKHGAQVEVIVRRAIQGDNLLHLAEQVQQAFIVADEEEREARSAFAKLELGMVKQFSELRKPVL